MELPGGIEPPSFACLTPSRISRGQCSTTELRQSKRAARSPRQPSTNQTQTELLFPQRIACSMWRRSYREVPYDALDGRNPKQRTSRLVAEKWSVAAEATSARPVVTHTAHVRADRRIGALAGHGCTAYRACSIVRVDTLFPLASSPFTGASGLHVFVAFILCLNIFVDAGD